MSGLAETLTRLSQMRDALTIPTSWPNSRLAPLAFASNPGNLDARCYVPPGLGAGAPLVVVLHGCTQTADAYDHGTGWSLLAERHGFALLYPEQRRSNNANLCFNWFSPNDIRRDSGETGSIKAMIDAMVEKYRLDTSRVFISGLSAGGAMAAAMLAAYPDVFAAGDIIAGLPYGVARSMPEAFAAMRGKNGQSSEALGNLVREAAPKPAHWPRVTVWQGTTDSTVAATNADALVAQWLDVHGLPNRPSFSETIDGGTSRVWRDRAGQPAVEAITVAGMGHGVPLDPARNPGEIAGPYMLDAGVSSLSHALRAWGLDKPAARKGRKTRKAAEAVASSRSAQTTTEAGSRKVLGVSDIINAALRSAGLLR